MSKNKLGTVLIMVGVVALFIANPVIGFIAVGAYLLSKD